MATLKRLGKQGTFVLTQTPARGERVREAAEGLSVLGLVSPVRIVHRHAYQDAQGRGQGVTEFEPRGKAAEEVRRLWAWIITQMEKHNGE